MRSNGYHAVTLLDLDNPLAPAWLNRAGVDYLYAAAPPTEQGPDGSPVIAATQRERWESALRTYEGTGTGVLLMGGFYIEPPEEHQAVDAFGRKHPMACFRSTGFQQAMTERIVALATAFSGYPAFAGFVFDDGPHVRVDCCYCRQCREQFREQHHVRPPVFEPRKPGRRVRDDDPILLWEQFQQESWQIYLRTQSEAVRSVSDSALMLTIPSDSYFYGRFLNVAVDPEETRPGHLGRLQRIERIQPERWHIFQSFPLARVPEADESGLQPWALGAHITAQSPKMLMQTEGPYAPTYERVQYMSPEEIERMARVTITEGAAGLCYWTPAGPLPSYPAAFDALAEVYRDVERIEETLARRMPVEANVGVLYSTTTETMEQPWERETSERWRHLHAYEGVLYGLLRSNVPFETVMETSITPERLARLKALVLPSVRWLSASALSAIERAIAERDLVVLAAGECVTVRGMTASGCDPLIWHNRARRGYRQERYADQQWSEVRNTLAPHLLPLIDAPVRVYSDRAIGRVYALDGGGQMLMVVSWDLEDLCEVAVEGEGRATDLLSGREMGALNDLGRLTVPPAGWRVLRVSQ
ncbi:MAG: hypothetical protein ACOX9R_19220 [Armatimonadota bacterium]